MNKQRGGVLIASLVVLMLLALVGLSGANTTTLEERMAGNFRDQRVAFESAESVLIAAEQWVESNDLDPISASACRGSQCFTADCSDGLCFNGSITGQTFSDCRTQDPAVPVYHRSHPLDVWNSANRHQSVSSAQQIAGVQSNGRFVVEFLCYVRMDPAVPVQPLAHGSAAFFRDFAEMYRITALGQGATPNSVSLVQSTYRKVR